MKSSRFSSRSSLAITSAFGLSILLALGTRFAIADNIVPYKTPPSGNVSPTFTSVTTSGDVVAGGNLRVGNVIMPKTGGTLTLDASLTQSDGEAYFTGKVSTDTGISVKDSDKEKVLISKDGIQMLNDDGKNLGALTGQGTLYANRFIVAGPGAGNLDNVSLNFIPDMTSGATIDSSGNLKTSGSVKAYGGFTALSPNGGAAVASIDINGNFSAKSVGKFYKATGAYGALHSSKFKPGQLAQFGAMSTASCTANNHPNGRLLGCVNGVSAAGTSFNATITDESCSIVTTLFNDGSQVDFGYQTEATCFDPTQN